MEGATFSGLILVGKMVLFQFECFDLHGNIFDKQ